jgi:hypothetical protein
MSVNRVANSFVWIRVLGPSGQRTAISIPVADHNNMLRLARGSSEDPVARVAEVCRDAADKLRRMGYTGCWSSAVRRRALATLRGSYIPARAAAHTDSTLSCPKE